MIVNIHIQKTAGTSTVAMIKSNLNLADNEIYHGPSHLDPNYEEDKHEESLDQYRLLSIHPIRSFRDKIYHPVSVRQVKQFNPSYFTFLRDPYKRMISHCNQINTKTDEFHKFYLAQDFQYYSLHKFFNEPNDLIQTLEDYNVFVGIFEIYDRDILALGRHLGINQVTVSTRKYKSTTAKFDYTKCITVEEFKERNSKDYMLYEHFIKKK